jgi:glycosyltransferase involved in cell wall biosynthesis
MGKTSREDCFVYQLNKIALPNLSMHILFITELYPEYAGQSPLEMNPALHNFVTEWEASGTQVTVVVPVVTRDRLRYGKGKILHSLEIDGVSVTQISMPKLPGFKIYQCDAIVDFSIKHSFDVIVCHMQIALVAGTAVKKRTGKPLVFGVHRSDNTVLNIPSPNIKKRLFKRSFLSFLESVDGFAFRSFSVKKTFCQAYNIAGRPHTVAISGIPSEFIDQNPVFSYGSPPHIITSCKLIKQKNVHTVLEALGMLPQSLPWKYSIVGDGPERKNLENLVQKLDLCERVTFLGSVPREKNIQLLRSGDIFVMVSDFETLGLVYLEALAQGLLVIGSEKTGIDGVIHNEENGVLCPPGDSQPLARWLTKILKEHPVEIRKNGYNLIHGMTQKQCALNYLSFLSNIALNKKL